MTSRRWLGVAALAGVALFALSFVDGWIVHQRELRGEGFRHVLTTLSAWEARALPVMGVASAWALLLAAVAALAALSPSWGARRVVRTAGWPPVVAAFAILGLLVAAAVPISQDGHASSVDMTPGWPLGVGLALAASMVSATAAAAGASRRLLMAGVVVMAVVALLGASARWFGLQAAEGTGRNWSEGSYTRHATDGQPTERLVIRDGRFEIGDRWSGVLESSGWTVVLADDPACPDARGTYHAHAEGEADLRFVMVVDTCADGARGDDLETGIWRRDR